MNFKLGELFCGPGGMALGAKLAAEKYQRQYGGDLPIEHVWGVDRDPNAIKTYNANNLGEGIQCDATAFAENQSGCDHKTIGDFKRITALAFGFPCNDFSMVGKRKGTNGNFGLLYKAGIAAINHTNPKWFIAENVSGIHSANAGDAFRQILAELEAAGKGYNLTVNLYKFEDYGVPQYRHRYIIVGIRKDQKVEFRIPAPTHLNNHVSVKAALTRPSADGVTGQEFTRQQPQIEERLLFTPPWRNAWYLEEMLDMSAADRRTALAEAPWYAQKIQPLSDREIIDRIEACRLHCTRARMSHIYRRLHPKKPSYTITGSGGGGTHVYHWEKCRALTNRERARLQGFPDDFDFKGQKEQVRKQIGMAVPPEGAKLIFEAILKTFAGVEYVHVPPSYQN
jgi:DNA (cytosine-5)-methyltransferase 1